MLLFNLLLNLLIILLYILLFLLILIIFNNFYSIHIYIYDLIKNKFEIKIIKNWRNNKCILINGLLKRC